MNEVTQELDASLFLEPAAEIERISCFIRGEVKRRGVHGVVIGLSGGLDSTVCAYLCARCLPAKQIHLFSLPERDSAAPPHEQVQAAARALRLPVEERDLSELGGQLGLYERVPRELAGNRALLERSIGILRRLSGSESLYLWAQQYAFGRRRGLFAKVLARWLWPYAGTTETFIIGKLRTRMLALSVKAMQMDCLLVCTTDRSEWSIGFYDPHGDGVGDIAPLCHLYKTQIRELARALRVPDGILTQPSSGDLAAGLPNEVAIGLRYEQLDRVLAGLSLGITDDALAKEAGVRRATVKALRAACKLADERRNPPRMLDTALASRRH